MNIPLTLGMTAAHIAVDIKDMKALGRAITILGNEHELMLTTILQLHNKVNGCGFTGQITGECLKKLGVKA